MTAVKVIDASALEALLFGETEVEIISARLRGGRLWSRRHYWATKSQES